MNAHFPTLALALLLSTGSLAAADDAVFFEEQFAGPSLNSAVWRTEILTSGARFCLDTSAPWSPGHWVDEGVDCHGTIVEAPYGSATLSDGLIHMSSDNDRAFPGLLSRLPGTVPIFPPSGDFTFKVRMRYDRVTPWGTGVQVYQTPSTEPSGDTQLATPDDLLIAIWCDQPGGGITIYTGVGGSLQSLWGVAPEAGFHEFGLECVGTSYSITVDGLVVFGPVSSDLRPTAILAGNPVVAFWYPTDWTSLSIDYFRVELPMPVPVEEASWGTVKARYARSSEPAIF